MSFFTSRHLSSTVHLISSVQSACWLAACVCGSCPGLHAVHCRRVVCHCCACRDRKSFYIILFFQVPFSSQNGICNRNLCACSPFPSLPVLAFDPSRFLPTPTIPPPLCLCLCLSVSLSLSLSLYLFPSLTNTFSLSPSPSLPWRFVSSSSPLPLPLPLGDPRENSKTGTRSLNEKS